MAQRRSSWRVLAAAGGVLALSACGTTVPLSGSAGQLAGDGFTSGTGPGAVGVPGQPGAHPGTVPGGAGAPVAGGPGSAAPTDPTGVRPVTGARGPVPTGPRDTSPVRVGLFYLEGGNAAIGAAFGNTPVSFGDGRLEARAVVDDINKHGGVGGRRILPFFAGVQAQNANPPGIEAACRKLVDDDHVSVIMSMFNVNGQLVECAKKAGVLLLDVALGAGDEYLYKTYPTTLFTPTQMNRDNEMRLVVKVAKAQGLLKGAKVGVVVQQDDPMYQRVYDNTLAPLLRSLGVPVQAVTIANGTATGEISSAVLKFSTEGVNRVMFSAGNGGIPEVFFMQTAQQQRYQPTYIMGDSTDTWFVQSAAPEAQVRNITGAGTYPVANVPDSEYPPTPAEKRCLEVISKAGQPVSNRHSSLTATFYCEMLYGFDAVGDTVLTKLTSASWRDAYYRLGTRYPAITTFHANLANGRNDNPDRYRVLGWKDACSCVTYLSPERPLPF